MVVIFSLLAIWQVVRQAVVVKYSGTDPDLASMVWAGHPAISFKVDLDRIAVAAASGRPVPRNRIDHIMARAQWAPLAPEPFLVRGVDAQLAGREAIAESAFAAAKQRDPESIAARYFLADQYLRTSQPAKGLVELGALTRLVPGSIEKLAPYYASYAKQAGGEAQLKRMLRLHPDLEPAILGVLAGDAGNADLVLGLSRGTRDAVGNPAGWPSRLIESLLEAGQYAKARAVWARIAHVPAASLAETLVFDTRFQSIGLPPPFAWTLSSSGSGIAEGAGDGRLHVVYFGRDNAVLASQTLLLKPGRYRLAFDVEGISDSSALAWTIRCRPGTKRVMALSLGKGGAGRRVVGDFDVMADCPAQLLELNGTAPDFPQTIDTTVAKLDLSRVQR